MRNIYICRLDKYGVDYSVYMYVIAFYIKIAYILY